MTSKQPHQIPPKAAQTQPVDPAARRVQQAPDTHGRRLQELESEVRDLATKVDSLEQASVAPPSPSDLAAELQQGAPRRAAASASPQTPAEEEPTTPQTRLQDVLPEVKELAQKVGGMERLAQIIETLKPSKE